MDNRKLTIVIPVYNEEESLCPLYDEIMKHIPELKDLIGSYELLFVDDGSSDNSVQVIKELAEKILMFMLLCSVRISERQRHCRQHSVRLTVTL